MEQTDRIRERRDEFWRGVGQLGAQCGPLGDADEPALWPTGSSAYLHVVTAHSGVVATDGLSDPSGDEGESAAPGLGVEVYVEGRELVEGPEGEGRWLATALEEAAGAIAGAGTSLGEALACHDLLSLELSAGDAPADWVAEGRLGALVGVELPGRGQAFDVEGGRVRALALTPLRPSELAVVTAEGAAGRRRIAEALADAGWYSYADSTRPSVA
ncbi:hypothetical protein [Janibacter sp. LM]|uniref:hypothetical protein n=1 Tax=Janibacter sp. LM TaxID=3144845 RepID=UPI0031F6402F